LCRMALGVVLLYGAQFLRFDGRPGESQPRHTSWWLLCLSRGGFEGGRAGVLAWSSFVHQFQGPVDEGSRAVQRPTWRRPVSSGLHSVGNGSAVPGMATQHRGWPHRAGGDKGDASWRHPGWTLNWWSYAFRERHCPLSRGVARRKDESWWHSATK
jgi:hypothetical protein